LAALLKDVTNYADDGRKNMPPPAAWRPENDEHIDVGRQATPAGGSEGEENDRGQKMRYGPNGRQLAGKGKVSFGSACNREAPA